MATKAAKRKARTVPFSARVPEGLARQLKDYARQHGITTSQAAVRLLEESIRMALFPGIDFRTAPSGRHAHVAGTGFAAWEVHMMWEGQGRNVDRVLKFHPGLRAAQVRVAASYIETYPEEKPGPFTPPPGMQVVEL
jgi:uncharacterized protein (DUF433 family)